MISNTIYQESGSRACQSWLRPLVLAALLCLPCLSLHARNFYGYTKDRPLVIACDWDFHPYEFLDSYGRPSGYNVEVLDLILTRLDIPHRFIMREWHEATAMFERHDADLIHALAFYYRSNAYITTKKYINYYNLKVARRLDVPPLEHISNLDDDDTLLLKQNDYADLSLKAMGDSTLNLSCCSPKEGLTNIRNGHRKYYIWGEVPLAHKIQELHIDSLVIDPIDIPAGELRIIGYDDELIDIIDDEFTRLEQAGELQNIADRWFHPERVHDDASPISLYLLGAIVLSLIVIFLFSRIVASRLKLAVRRHDELNSMMEQALSMGNFYVVVWDLQEQMVHNVHGDILPPEGMNPQEFLDRLVPEEAKTLHEANLKISAGEIEHFDLELTVNRGTPEHPDIKHYKGSAMAERLKGKPRYILYTVHDFTQELNDEERDKTIANKYRRMFETNFVAMSFYDTEGRLVDVNQKMCELCELNDEDSKHFFHDTNLFDNPMVKGELKPDSMEPLHVCQHMYYPAIGLDKYIEIRISPTADNEGRLVYYIVTARDCTVERDLYRSLLQHDKQLRQTEQSINHYEAQLRYLLEESNMYVWKFNLAERQIYFSHTLREAEYSMSIDDYFDSISEEHREKAREIFLGSLMQGKPFSIIHRFDRTLINSEPTWYSIGGMPISDNEGTVQQYFGIARNITDLMQAQLQLRDETKRAEDSGRLKGAFLANMTHEIRTPLNAIVGFSDLLQVVDTPEERMEFIRIIRNNCDMLLRLINDILEASSMGQSMAIEPTTIDLSRTFDDICQTLQQRVQEPGVEFQKDNPYPTFPAVLDRGRIQQVLTNFVTNAVKYTHEGHIRVGYREQDGGIYFYCEDTGAGIPKDKQASVFERFVKLNDFVQGTGLGLSICKTIVERCGGHIGVNSEGEGKGSTFWFWTPRVIKGSEK